MFLSIVTRTMPGRDSTLYRLIDSITEQNFENCEHIIFDGGADLYDANLSLYEHRDDIHGDYVLIVDDDDYMLDDTLRGLEQAVKIDDGELYRVGVRCGFDVPDDRPCSISSFVARRDAWLECCGAFRVPSAAPVHFVRYAESKYEPRYIDRDFVVRERIGQSNQERNERMRQAWQEGARFSTVDCFIPGDVFCYGANNLPFLSNCCESVTVVEYDARVDGTFNNYWQRLGPATIDYGFVPIAFDDDPLAEFAEAIASYDTFGAVFIEGRCPARCVELARKHINGDGLIVLNSHRARRYESIMSELELVAEHNDGTMTTGIFELR